MFWQKKHLGSRPGLTCEREIKAVLLVLLIFIVQQAPWKTAFYNKQSLAIWAMSLWKSVICEQCWKNICISLENSYVTLQSAIQYLTGCSYNIQALCIIMQIAFL